jgi:citrate synthase
METAVEHRTTSVRDLIAETLDIDESEVHGDLGLHSVAEWSSLDHVTLMVAIEERFGLVVDSSAVARLTTVAAIERFVDGGVDPVVALPASAGPVIHRGLDGVHLDETSIVDIDGPNGRLSFRGVAIEDIATADYASVCHLILDGDIPSAFELAPTVELLSPTGLPPLIAEVVRTLTDEDPINVLVATLPLLLPPSTPADDNTDGPPADSTGQALWLAGMARQILALHHGAGSVAPPAPDQAATDHPVSERFLWNFFGTAPSPLEVEAFDLVSRIQVEHGSNASALAARVAASTNSGLGLALVAAIGTFAGPRHGAAIADAMAAIDEIGAPALAEDYVTDRRSRRLPIPGFGHRVYKGVDPRVPPLKLMARRLADATGDRHAFEVMEALEAAMGPLQRHGLTINVDPYAAVILHLLGFPTRYLTALYAAARIPGWSAHVVEQVDRNVLIRPLLHYVGPKSRRWDDGAIR